MQLNYRNSEAVAVNIATDRNLLYGDGVFTTIELVHFKPVFLERHIDRLLNDSGRLKIQAVSKYTLYTHIQKALAEFQSNASSNVNDHQNVGHGVLRISISRDSGSRGYFCINGDPVYWISISKSQQLIEQRRMAGINLCFCEQIISRNISLAGIKHCNRIEQIMARNEWTQVDIVEGLMSDDEGNVIEGTMSNLFLIKENTLYTPDLTFSGVNGVMRMLVIEAADALNIELNIDQIPKQDVRSFESLFITNSLIHIWPVNQLSGRTFNQHPIIKELQNYITDISKASIING